MGSPWWRECPALAETIAVAPREGRTSPLDAFSLTGILYVQRMMVRAAGFTLLSLVGIASAAADPPKPDVIVISAPEGKVPDGLDSVTAAIRDRLAALGMPVARVRVTFASDEVSVEVDGRRRSVRIDAADPAAARVVVLNALDLALQAEMTLPAEPEPVPLRVTAIPAPVARRSGPWGRLLAGARLITSLT